MINNILNNTALKTHASMQAEEPVGSFLRKTLLYLQILLLFPLYSSLPLWLSILCACCLLLRAFLNFKHYVDVQKGVVLACLIIIVVGLLYEFLSSGFNLTVNISFLVALYVLKALELRSHRDVLWILYLSTILIACVFFVNQSLVVSFYLVFCFIGVLSLLIVLYRRESAEDHFFQDLKRSVWLVLQSLPLMLVLVIFIPRIDPLWSVPSMQGQALTGMSDSMRPGSISKLLRSDALVFRAGFTERVPEKSELYWRGLALNYFDGREWKAEFVSHNSEIVNANLEKQSLAFTPTSALDYEVILEPANSVWLYGLVAPVLSGNQLNKQLESDLHLSKALTLFSSSPNVNRLQYSVKTYRRQEIEQKLTEKQRAQAIDFPVGSNPLAVAQAQKWLSQVDGDHERLVNLMLNWISTEKFYYTLSPPILQDEAFVDDFLFTSRRGFCEHFSGSFAFLLRAAGVPARVVVGYQGGNIDPIEKLVSVRQLDAHAWVEWWSEQKGWQTVDPTSAVSPLRILEGAESVLGGESEFLAGSFSLYGGVFRHLGFLRTRWDSVNNSWNRWALGFNEKQRQNALKNLIGELSLKNIVKWFSLLMAIGVMMFFLLLKLSSYSWSRKQSEWVRNYQRIQQLLPLNIEMLAAYLTPQEWRDIAVEKYPQLKNEIDEYITSFNALEYRIMTHLKLEQKPLVYSFRKRARRLERQILSLRLRHSIKF